MRPRFMAPTTIPFERHTALFPLAIANRPEMLVQ